MEEGSGGKHSIVSPTNLTFVPSWPGHKVLGSNNMRNHRWMLQESHIQKKLGVELSRWRRITNDIKNNGSIVRNCCVRDFNLQGGWRQNVSKSKPQMLCEHSSIETLENSTMPNLKIRLGEPRRIGKVLGRSTSIGAYQPELILHKIPSFYFSNAPVHGKTLELVCCSFNHIEVFT